MPYFRTYPIMTAKKTTRKNPSTRKIARKAQVASARPASLAFSVASGSSTSSAQSLLLVCIQDPFETAGSVSRINRASIPSIDGNLAHQWQLESVMEMNVPAPSQRFFEGWATAGSFTLDVKVNASAILGAWGSPAKTGTTPGSCRILIMRDGESKVKFSLASGAVHAPEKPMPRPDSDRFLNGDIGFELNGSSGISVAASVVVSKKPWSTLIAGSTVATKGLAFDGKWRANLEKGDGDVVAAGSWSFAVMTREAYQAFCNQQGFPGMII